MVFNLSSGVPVVNVEMLSYPREVQTVQEKELPGHSPKIPSCRQWTPLSFEIKQIILSHYPKLSPLKISRLLAEKYGFATTRQSIWRFVKSYYSTGNLFKKTRKARQRRVTEVHIRVIDKWLHENNELSSGAIAAKLKKTFCLEVSKGYICKIRRNLGWTCRRVKYCQLISHINREKRLTYAMEMQWREEKFLNVIFTDETTVEMNSKCRLFFYKPDSDLTKLPARKQKPKHSYKDNDPKHKSKSTKTWMKEKGMLENVMESPPSSPDLNPIENVWAAMKQYLQNTVKPKKKEELVAGIVDYWRSLTPEKCASFIDHLHRVLPHVVLNYGHPSGF